VKRSFAAATLAIVAATAAPLAAQRARPWDSPEVLPSFKMYAFWKATDPRTEVQPSSTTVTATLINVPDQAQVEAMSNARQMGIIDAFGTCTVTEIGRLKACRWRDIFPASTDAHRFVARLIAPVRVADRASNTYNARKIYVRVRWEDDGEVVGTPPDCGPVFCGVSGLQPAPVRMPVSPGE